jgi:hypothetical protein
MPNINKKTGLTLKPGFNESQCLYRKLENRRINQAGTDDGEPPRARSASYN